MYIYLTDYVEYDGVCMMFCDVVQFTQQNNMEKALKDLNQAYRWLARLCQVFNLDIVSSILFYELDNDCKGNQLLC